LKAITVDASKAIRSIIRWTLKAIVFEVEEAEGGLVALERIKAAWAFDLAIVD